MTIFSRTLGRGCYILVVLATLLSQGCSLRNNDGQEILGIFGTPRAFTIRGSYAYDKKNGKAINASLTYDREEGIIKETCLDQVSGYVGLNSVSSSGVGGCVTFDKPKPKPKKFDPRREYNK